MTSPAVTTQTFAEGAELREALRKRFDRNQIGRLPKVEPKDGKKGRPALDFVSHAIVTDRLNFVAPGWTYTIDETFMWEQAYWIRGTITIGGVSRPEFGDGDNPKDAIANFICRGAMRFGVALDLWQKQDGEASSSPAQVTPTPSGVVSGRDGEDRGAGEAADGEAVSEPAPQTPADSSEKADLSFHPGKPHRMRPAPDFPGYLMCRTSDKCRFWEYVGTEEGAKI